MEREISEIRIIAAFQRLFHGRRIRRTLARQVELLTSQLSHIDERVRILTRHASDHFLALSKESMQSLVVARRVLGSTREMIAHVEHLLRSGKGDDLQLAEKLMRQLCAGDREFMTHWRKQLERCIQTVGGEVYRASDQYRLVVREANHRMRQTIEDLIEMGVRPERARANGGRRSLAR